MRTCLASALLAALLAACGRPPAAVVVDGGAIDALVSAEPGPTADLPRREAGLTDRARGEAPPLPDLLVRSFKATTGGSTITYAVEICNGGASQAPAFSVDLYYSSPAAPPVKQPGDQGQAQKPLAAGSCISLTLQRVNTPSGTSRSWVRLDQAELVAESDESNNLGGPLVVEVPPLPDLVITKLDAGLSPTGTDIVYDVTLCNQGTAGALLFRVDLYYKRALPPGPLQVGDVSHYVLALLPGACQSFSQTYKDAPVGLYTSWAFVDTLGTVKESNESNNTAGPRLVVVSPPGDCGPLCVFAATCGAVKIAELPQCLTWCNQLAIKEKSCATAARQAGSCPALTACKLPPLPPAPPVIWDCLPLCNFVIGTCNLLPQGSLLTCVAGCLTLPSTKKQCGLDAMNKKQCVQAALCLL